MRIHILGICGTFMAGVAVIAKQLGYEVSGCDQNVYPPMSTFLESQDIAIEEGYNIASLDNVDVVIVGNVVKRGMPIIEYILNRKTPIISGPEWLSQHALSDKWVLCVAGTHGKTTTASMLAWILEKAGLEPGFLIGGLAQDFDVSARISKSPYFVIEGDEYDTAFFDKRSKFVHYHPKTLVINNLEFDHADIFDDLKMIQRQFHHLLKIVPSEGLVLHPNKSSAVDEVLSQGLWTPGRSFGEQGDWRYELLSEDGSSFAVYQQDQKQGEVHWSNLGRHNCSNALAAIAAAHHAGVEVDTACAALAEFKGVKRRLEKRGCVDGVTVYDDFAHHPTAVAETLRAMKAHVSDGRVVAILEPRSNTMRMGMQAKALADALALADEVFLFQSGSVSWDVAQTIPNAKVFSDVQQLIDAVHGFAQSGDHLVVMSNGGFENIHERLLAQSFSSI